MQNLTSQRLCKAYVRVSTDDQGREGSSRAAQEERIRALCVATDRDLSEVIVETESAKTLSRNGLQVLLKEIRVGKISTLVIFKLDRLTRSVRDLADLLEILEQHNVALVSVSESLDTSTAAGRLMLNLLGSVSQWER